MGEQTRTERIETAMRFALLALLAAIATAQQHPTLPTDWTADTIEPGRGGTTMQGVEAYHFVDKPSRGNPSAIWSNYSDCQRLIYDEGGAVGGPGQQRYLFKCDAVNCCHESQKGNHKEYQIPDWSFFGKKATVSPLGKQTVTSFGEQIETDGWSWKIPGIGTTSAFTTGEGANITLHLWDSKLKVGNLSDVKVQFHNYRAVPADQMPAFVASFARPAHHECPLSCQSARSQGKLRSYKEAWTSLA